MTIDPNNLPNGPFQITDDASARTFLEALHILHKLVRPSSLPDIWTTNAVYTHATHHIIVAWYEGFPVSEENGIVVQGWPRSIYTRDQVVSAVKQTLSQHTSETDPWFVIE